MQEQINKYFEKLCADIFFKNDDETIIGSAQNVINNLNEQLEYSKKELDPVEEKEELEIITEETDDLIQEIKDTYLNLNDVIMLSFHPMAGFYVLCDKKKLLQELKEYYEELEEKKNEN